MDLGRLPSVGSVKLTAEKSPSLIPILALVLPCTIPTPGARAQRGTLSPGGGGTVALSAELAKMALSGVTVRLATGAGGYCFSTCESCRTSSGGLNGSIDRASVELMHGAERRRSRLYLSEPRLP